MSTESSRNPLLTRLCRTMYFVGSKNRFHSFTKASDKSGHTTISLFVIYILALRPQTTRRSPHFTCKKTNIAHVTLLRVKVSRSSSLLYFFRGTSFSIFFPRRCLIPLPLAPPAVTSGTRHIGYVYDVPCAVRSLMRVQIGPPVAAAE